MIPSIVLGLQVGALLRTHARCDLAAQARLIDVRTGTETTLTRYASRQGHSLTAWVLADLIANPAPRLGNP
jgi:hypothetical protein